MGNKAEFRIVTELDGEVDKERIEDYVWTNFVPYRDEIEVRDVETGEVLYSNDSSNDTKSVEEGSK